ncbi:hypothetical protein HORM4_460002 [Vibrio harveyi]|nr:hypothetical protein HORM4_460002 [Vibrio harveyi]
MTCVIAKLPTIRMVFDVPDSRMRTISPNDFIRLDSELCHQF